MAEDKGVAPDAGNDAVGSWIRMDSRLEATEEFMAILCALDLDRMGQDGVDILLGTLKRFWVWFDERTEAGFMRFATERSIDAKIGRPGFAAAMIRVEWLSITDQGAQLPEFEKRHGKSEKKRMESARRAKRSRRLAKEEQALRDAGILDDERPRTPSARGAHGKRTRSAHTTTTTTTNSSSTARSKAVEAAASLKFVNALPEDWTPAVKAVRSTKAKLANWALQVAAENGYEPALVVEVVAFAKKHKKQFKNAAGAVVDRLTTVGPEVAADEQWPVTIASDPPPRPPSRAVEREMAIARLRASNTDLTPEEAGRMVDSQMALTA